MKIMECSPFREEDGTISINNLLRGTWAHGVDWRKKMQDQDKACERLQSSLDKNHLLLKNVAIPGKHFNEPMMVLLSPQGVRVLMVSSARGNYRAKGSEWLRYSDRIHRFKRTRPNLQTIVLDMTKSLAKELQNLSFQLPNIEAVLIFTNPRTLIDTARPRARIVPADAISFFAANLQQLPPIMEYTDLRNLARALLLMAKPETKPSPQVKEAVNKAVEIQAIDEIPSAQVALPEVQTGPDIRTGPKVFGLNRIQLERRQWAILAGLIILEILILIIFAVLLSTSMNLIQIP